MSTASSPPAQSLTDARRDADALAARLPELRIDAARIAGNLTVGWHGRRRAGPGETFWQFRGYGPGEAASRIDWRRSARGDTLHVRENEWESAHTARFWVDASPSMLFRSKAQLPQKLERALVLTLALAEVLQRGGERIAMIGTARAFHGARALDPFCAVLAQHLANPRTPAFDDAQPGEEIILISDFLEAKDTLEQRFASLAATGARAHLLQIIDPAEESFPYAGRTRFIDPETGGTMTSGRAEDWRTAYRELFQARMHWLGLEARRRGWTHARHHSDHGPAPALLALHQNLGAQQRPGGSGGRS